ncbi:uncharacterized protein LOC131040000 isoform X1 [Cryptomeria japonica]|uniref:uncharacterized protein LOC131040000 isoform X1 n=1 Tax=Cryptomeria japonica TaxID=3369 RepID=UPI0027D9F1A9|nr:uncharacterized protein LOC131040000 isoform X1 [Cryptomeria japonica]
MAISNLEIKISVFVCLNFLGPRKNANVDYRAGLHWRKTGCNDIKGHAQVILPQQFIINFYLSIRLFSWYLYEMTNQKCIDKLKEGDEVRGWIRLMVLLWALSGFTPYLLYMESS